MAKVDSGVTGRQFYVLGIRADLLQGCYQSTWVVIASHVNYQLISYPKPLTSPRFSSHASHIAFTVFSVLGQCHQLMITRYLTMRNHSIIWPLILNFGTCDAAGKQNHNQSLPNIIKIRIFRIVTWKPLVSEQIGQWYRIGNVFLGFSWRYLIKCAIRNGMLNKQWNNLSVKGELLR